MFRNALILFCLLTIPLRANLGETIEQCVARYGRPVGFSEANPKFPFGTVVFTATGYTLVVFTAKNKEVGARVSKLDKSAFADAEMKMILGADSGATPWTTTTSDDPTCLKWIRDDKATVLYDKTNHVLIFTSLDMTNAFHSSPASSPAPAPAPAPASAPATTNAPAPSP